MLALQQISPPIYRKGTCITPVSIDYSWYRKPARVVAFSNIEGFGEERRYILSFPKHGTSSVIFSQKEIETHTKRVDDSYCN